jgi:hypothetical protein
MFMSEGARPACGAQVPNPDSCVWVRDSRDVAIFSYGGNMKPLPTGAPEPPGFAQFPPAIMRVEVGALAGAARLSTRVVAGRRTRVG